MTEVLVIGDSGVTTVASVLSQIQDIEVVQTMPSYYWLFDLPYDFWNLMNYRDYSWPVPRKSNQRKIRKLRRRTRP